MTININSGFGALTTDPAGGSFLSAYSASFPCSGTACSPSITLKNPSSSGTYTFALTTSTADDFQVGVSTSSSWTFDCSTTNCRSCLANNSCLTCYTSIISNYYIFSTATSDCIRACSPGSFLVNSTCSPCDSNCT